MLRKIGIIAIVILITIGLILAGCGEKEPAPAPAPTPAPSPAPEPSPAPQVIEWKLGSWMPPMALGQKIVDNWVKKVEEETGGSLHITVYAANTLCAQDDLPQALFTGQCEVATTDGGRPQSLTRVAMLPFMFPSSEISAKVNYDLNVKYYSVDEYQDVKVAFFYPTPPTHIFSNIRHIKTLEDFEGLKLCAGQIIETNTLETLGAASVVIPRTEIFTALERGLAEGNVANWEQAFVFKDFEVTKYRTKVGMWSAPMQLVMSPEAFSKLPSDIQKVIDDNCGIEASAIAGKTFDEVDAQFRGMIAEFDEKAGNPEVYDLPAAEKERWRETTRIVHDNWVAKWEDEGLPAKAVLEDAYALTEKYSQ